MMEYLFVYGTLLDGVNPAAQYLLSNAEFFAEGYFNGKLFDLGDYPGAVLSENQNEKVFGELLVIRNPESVFAVLDEYEETGDKFPAPNEFIRTKIEVFDNKGKPIPSYVYLYNWPVDNLKHIISGKYNKNN